MAKLRLKEVRKKLKEGRSGKNPLKTPFAYDVNALKSAVNILKKIKALKKLSE